MSKYTDASTPRDQFKKHVEDWVYGKTSLPIDSFASDEVLDYYFNRNFTVEAAANEILAETPLTLGSGEVKPYMRNAGDPIVDHIKRL